MLSGEFLDDDVSAPADAEPCRPMREPYFELGLLSLEEAEAERRGRR
jgi:hypothetical protein